MDNSQTSDSYSDSESDTEIQTAYCPLFTTTTRPSNHRNPETGSQPQNNAPSNSEIIQTGLNGVTICNDPVHLVGSHSGSGFNDAVEIEYREGRTVIGNLVEEVLLSSDIPDDQFLESAEIHQLEMDIAAQRAIQIDPEEAARYGFIGSEYGVILEQVMETENALRGKPSPPASKAVVESLPFVESADKGCPVCKDDVLLGETVRKLPCLHCFHDGCIRPWLAIRNTCPVCRFELLTDDHEYETRKSLVLHGRRLIEGAGLQYGLL